MDEYELVDFVNELSLDLRVEVVLADLVNSGYTLNDIFVRPAGIFQRRFKKDIRNAEVVELVNHQEVVFINANREGLYDTLPQTIFHNAPGKATKAFKSSKEMIDEYKLRIIEEADARKFFSAYEIEFYRQRIANEILENRLFEALSYSMNDAEILSYWKLPGIFDKRQKGILFYLFPVFHKIRGNTKYMEEIFRMIVQQKITVTCSDDFNLHHFDDDKYKLGKINLAVNSVLGNKTTYYYNSYHIDIGPLETDQVKHFLQGGINRSIIEKLTGFFVPIHCDSVINIHSKKSEWILGNEMHSEKRLGFSIAI